MTIPRIIHQTWKNETIPAHFALLVDTWKQNHPGWEYVLWTDEMNRTFIQEHFPAFIDQYDAFKYNIQRVDAVRYFILYKLGGVYVDLDFECIKNLEPLLENEACVMGVEPPLHCAIHKKDMIISNAFMACAPGNPFMQALCEEMAQIGETIMHANDYILSTTGPFMLTRVYDRFANNGAVTLLEPDKLYALTKDEIVKVVNGDDVDSTIQEKIDNAYGIHYYWGTWWRQGI